MRKGHAYDMRAQGKKVHNYKALHTGGLRIQQTDSSDSSSITGIDLDAEIGEQVINNNIMSSVEVDNAVAGDEQTTGGHTGGTDPKEAGPSGPKEPTEEELEQQVVRAEAENAKMRRQHLTRRLVLLQEENEKLVTEASDQDIAQRRREIPKTARAQTKGKGRGKASEGQKQGTSETINSAGAVFRAGQGRGSDCGNGTNVTLKELRKMESLQKKADSELRQHWNLSTDEDTGDETTVSADYVDLSGARKRTAKKKRKFKLPVDSLKYGYVNQNKQMNTIDIRLFVAGEMGTILNGRIGSTETLARLKMLETLMYHAGNFQWQAVKTLYMAVLDDIEGGRCSWGD